MTQLLLTHGTEEKKFIKSFMQYIPLSQHLFFLIKRKAVLKIHELGWMNAANGMSLPVSDHFAKQRKSSTFPGFSYMRQFTSNTRMMPKFKQIYKR